MPSLCFQLNMQRIFQLQITKRLKKKKRKHRATEADDVNNVAFS